MDIVNTSIRKPVGVLVVVILVVMFGLIGLYSMPYQLSPTVVMPEISVTTVWPGATPYDIEREIIEEQEEALKGLTGLEEMESSAYNAYAEISLKFAIGTDVDNALLRVSNKLDEVSEYPDTAEKPILNATGASTSPVIWMILKTLPENEQKIETYRTFFEDEVRQYLERVPGVADLFVFGGTEREMQVVVDPAKLSAYKQSLVKGGDSVVGVLRAENANVSAGSMQLGRREWRIRTVGEFQSPEDIEETVITSSGQRRVTVGDVAQAMYGYEKLTVAMMHNGESGIVCGVKPEPGANVLEVTDAAEKVVEQLNAGKLKKQGLYIDWAYDQREYINGAIDLVKQNILIGGLLAVVTLLVFLRSVSSTFIVAFAIPISVLGTFIFMSMLGRNLNVVSLAGISFAVGMLVDNAIVVLENVDRHRKMGKKAFAAAYDGAKEVWGAVVASTATTVAVFLPVVFMQQEAGQLFKDIAIAVTSAILISLFVSVSVIPMLAKQLYAVSRRPQVSGVKKKRKILGPGALFQSGFMALVRLCLWNWFTRIVTIVLLTSLAVGTAYFLFPKMEYLPQGNRNLILNILIPPPGLSYAERLDMGEYIFESLAPFRDKEEHQGMPGIRQIFYVGADRISIFGVVSTQEQRAGELIPMLNRVINSIPGMFGVSLQAGIFEERIGEGRSVNVDLAHGDMGKLVAGAGALYGAVSQAIPGAQIRPVPSLELMFPEVKLIPRRDRMRSAGLDTTSLGLIMDIYMDGRKVGEFKRQGDKKIDLVVKASEQNIATPEDLYQSMVVLPDGRSVPLSSLADLERTTGITQIRHLERRRTVTLQVTPPGNMPLEEAMNVITNQLVPQLKNGPLQDIDVSLTGAADKLTETRKALQWNFLLAVIITYLLMSALFGNFIYPLAILFTVPLAAAGGILGLFLENVFIAPQSLDILTMLGFVILIGVVVNNAILIVHQSLNNMRLHGMEAKEAVLESVRTRLRPIYMSACTSIFGMLPLVLAPGPGSELYRGLGSVVLGGLAVSTIFTVFVIPSMLLFFLWMEKPGKANKNGEKAEEIQTV